MRRKYIFAITVAINLTLISVMVGVVLADPESEPNDHPGEANPLYAGEEKTGAVGSIGDLDYYEAEGVNPTWGFIALLDTISSTPSKDAILTAYGPDGSTLLESDSGSWERGSGIALQAFSGFRESHYLRVEEDGGDETISTYSLRYFETIISTQPEVEPNETVSSGTPSAFSHAGTIDPAGDVDCYSFHGRSGDDIIIALDGDPEEDFIGADLVLSLVDPSGTELKSVDVSGIGGNEFNEYNGLANEGVYAYCVSAAGGLPGPGATYHVGLVRNGFLYFPAYSLSNTWVNRPTSGAARLGDTLSFRLAITNTSPVPIPGSIENWANYSEDCLSFLGAVPTPTETYTGTVSWEGQKSGLAPGEVYQLFVDLRAEAYCMDVLDHDIVIDYYLTGTGRETDYAILRPIYLPFVRR